MRELHFFDPNDDVSILERKLPHWSQAGVVCFITFRTHDSIPKSVLSRFYADRRHWLRSHGINPEPMDWREKLRELDMELQHEFFRSFSVRWHTALDQCAGACLLSNREHSAVVHDSLLHFDGDRYEMSDFVVMPNHVHLLVAFPDEDVMLRQCESWKHYTATKINQASGGDGRFWQQDGFDHLVRSVEQYEHFRRYIANNPHKAKLRPGQFRLYSSHHAPP